MASTNESITAAPEPTVADRKSLALAAKAGNLLPLCDFAGLLVVGYFSLYAYATFSSPALAPLSAWGDLHRLAWIAAVIAPFTLYEQRFAAYAASGDTTALVRSFARRFTVFLGVIFTIAFAGRWLGEMPRGVVLLWLGSAVLLTVTSRVLLARYLRHLSRQGAVTGTVAVTGVGPVPADFSTQNIAYVGDRLPVTLLADRPIKRWNAVLKSSSDFMLSSVIVVLVMPAVGCIALAIKLDSPGPILFKQRRHGFNNRVFDIYKFRTMRCAPEEPGATLQQTVRGDSRTTRVGRFLRKWSLDELPQVFNVLEGSMSLVGPRPHAVNMRTEQRLGHEITDAYLHRHRVKPGITGWSQVNGSRGATDTVEQLRRRVELDLYYVENWSLLLDLKILTLTSREVLRATNAY